jgi:hypothetical protein
MRRRERMTIAIGMLCRDGVVLGSDREMTLDTMKVDDTKCHLLSLRKDLRVGIAGAGTADLIRFSAQELDRRLKDSMSADDVRSQAEAMINELNTSYLANQSGVERTLDLLVGIKTATELRLLKVQHDRRKRVP